MACSILVALDGGSDRDPAHLAVNRTNDPVLHRVVAHVAGDRIAEFLLGDFAILGMDTPHPVFMRLIGCIGQQPVNGEIFRRTSIAKTGSEVDFEAADAADLLTRASSASRWRKAAAPSIPW